MVNHIRTRSFAINNIRLIIYAQSYARLIEERMVNHSFKLYEYIKTSVESVTYDGWMGLHVYSHDV